MGPYGYSFCENDLIQLRWAGGPLLYIQHKGYTMTF